MSDPIQIIFLFAVGSIVGGTWLAFGPGVALIVFGLMALGLMVVLLNS
jgi:hypothetical protein